MSPYRPAPPQPRCLPPPPDPGIWQRELDAAVRPIDLSALPRALRGAARFLAIGVALMPMAGAVAVLWWLWQF